MFADDIELRIPEGQKALMRKNKYKIVEDLQTNYLLLVRLIEKEIINQEIYDEIRSIKEETKRNTALFEFILKSSKAKLNRFIECLREDGQDHVACLVMEGDPGVKKYNWTLGTYSVTGK